MLMLGKPDVRYICTMHFGVDQVKSPVRNIPMFSLRQHYRACFDVVAIQLANGYSGFLEFSQKQSLA